MPSVSRRAGEKHVCSDKYFLVVGSHILMKVYFFTDLTGHFHPDIVQVPLLDGAGVQGKLLKWPEL